MSRRRPKQILLVTGMSGAGKSTVLRTLEDLGWETVDNLPLLLLHRLLDTPPGEGAEGDDDRPLALGIGTQTRGFDAESIVQRVKKLSEQEGHQLGTLFLECDETELERRYSETRRRHPLAQDRPASDGIARERELLMPLRRWSNRLIDTTNLSSNELQQQIRATFAVDGLGRTVLTIASFGFARGLPRDADLVFDMRFLRNPHWVEALRPGTGQDVDVSAYIAEDPAYGPAMAQIEALLLLLLPRYQAEGKAYVTAAFGCTGGRHRSVHVAERMARRLREEGFSPTVTHRDLQTAPQDSLEGAPVAISGGGV
ncbi:RNase adapter RapZ [Sphingomonas psychrotolerans]|uniref:RNase adapter RapZ n=1 Tax=Sphingomonas psychrotolerans TaxID=1327635 RepID=A0ABU3MZS3_9SPHN|nr:RNase adapter RapZ [Sphingomonas psychrotolerans]MDT8757800.1 RNase adapter RapZ [Sphingomonas psychrotolerans]